MYNNNILPYLTISLIKTVISNSQKITQKANTKTKNTKTAKEQNERKQRMEGRGCAICTNQS